MKYLLIYWDETNFDRKMSQEIMPDEVPGRLLEDSSFTLNIDKIRSWRGKNIS